MSISLLPLGEVWPRGLSPTQDLAEQFSPPVDDRLRRGAWQPTQSVMRLSAASEPFSALGMSRSAGAPTGSSSPTYQPRISAFISDASRLARPARRRVKVASPVRLTEQRLAAFVTTTSAGHGLVALTQGRMSPLC